MLHTKKNQIEKRHLRLLEIFGVFLLSLMCIPAEASESKPLKKMYKNADKGVMAKTISSVASYRMFALKDPMLASKKIMTNSAYAAWEKQVNRLDKEMRKAYLTDFFNTSVVFVAPQKMDSGISALYSPFLDVILLVQTDNIDQVSKIENFCFIAGNIFREENMKLEELPISILPIKSPFSISIMKIFAATEKKFQEFIKENKSIKNYSTLADEKFQFIARNMFVRSYFSVTLLKPDNKDALKLMGEILNFLKNKNLDQLKEKVKPGIFQKQVELYCSLPIQIQKDMKFCYYLSSSDRNLFVFCNKFFPRLIVVVTAEKNKKDAKWTFEFFDINLSASHLIGRR